MISPKLLFRRLVLQATGKPLFLLLSGVALSWHPAANAAEEVWHTQSNARWKSLPTLPQHAAGFTLLAGTETGVTFTNTLDDRVAVTNRNLVSGSGVALGDVDGDGRCDIYFCSLQQGNRLFRNLGNLRFEDITSRAGVACAGQFSSGATLVDIDGDGDLDLLVNALGAGTRLFLNDGKAQFREVTAESGLGSTSGSTSLALADIDGDGDLDVYVCNFRPSTILDRPGTSFRVENQANGPVVVAVDGRSTDAPDLDHRFVVTPGGEVLELGEVDGLYRNDGAGHFTRLSFTDGTFLDEQGIALKEPPRDWGLAAQFRDLNGDGYPDLYVCNDLFTADRIWMNDGHGHFKALSTRAVRNNSTFSMGVDFADINRDGFLDYFTVDMFSRDHVKRMTQVSGNMRVGLPPGVIDYRAQMNRNVLQLNRGDNTFAEIAIFAGVEASEWSWGPVFLDVDLDGYEDLLIPNGQLHDFQNADLSIALEAVKTDQTFSAQRALEILGRFQGLFTPNLAFRNRGDCTFEDVSTRWGFGTPVISQGIALGDLDNDGDLDVVVNNLNHECGVYRNDTSAPRLAIRLKGRGSNSAGVGGWIRIFGGPTREQSQEIVSGGRYLSGDDPMRVFAAGPEGSHLSIEVRWRSGKRSRISDVEGNRYYEIEEPESSPTPPPGPPPPLPPMFSAFAQWPEVGHHEEAFDDFERQPLLPRKLSQLGPGVAWADLDGDGWEDVIVGSGKGGSLQALRNLQGKGFERWNDPALSRPVGRDQSGLVTLGGAVLAGSANWEDGSTNGGNARLYDFRRKASGEILVGVEASTGPLCLADIDGDGDLDLFVGGRVIAGRYPEAASSKLFRNEGGRFVLQQKFSAVGLVSGAVFSDLDGDGDSDLILACEWGPIRIFINTAGKFEERPFGIERLSGWWNGITTADFDGDGRLDIAASNWGLNYLYAPSSTSPQKIYFGDLRGDGSVEMIESHFDADMKLEVPTRNLRIAGGELPFLREIATSFEAYGKASLQQLYGERLQGLKQWDFQFTETTVFLNRGDHFERVSLPKEAQFSPAFGIAAADIDGDGAEDLVLSQNFFAVAGDNWRSDSGRGLILLGNGKGQFEPVRQSGLEVYGEGRGLAVADFDADGRVDLLFAQNGAPALLYHNDQARPGLRVKVQGPPGNESGIGTWIRPRTETGWGPMREIKSGSGYWSQDSSILVLGSAQPILQVAFRRPYSTTWVTNEVPPNAKILSWTAPPVPTPGR